MIMKSRVGDAVFSCPETDNWVAHYDAGAQMTMVMLGDNIVDTIDGEASMEECTKLVLDHWIVNVIEPNMDTYNKMYDIWSNMSAVRVDGFTSDDWSLESVEEIESAIEDGDNPIVMSVYGVGNDGERFEFYFDLSDVTEGELQSSGFKAKDGEFITALVPYKGE